MLPSHASAGSAFAVLLIIVVLVIVLSGRSRKLGSGMSVLVLRRFAVSDDPQQETLVWITGRKSGLMGWILTVLGAECGDDAPGYAQRDAFPRYFLVGQQRLVVVAQRRHCQRTLR